LQCVPEIINEHLCSPRMVATKRKIQINKQQTTYIQNKRYKGQICWSYLKN